MVLFYFLSLIALFYIAQAKVTITKLDRCDPNKKYPIVFTSNMRTENGKHYVEGGMKSDIPLDDNLMIVADIYSKETADEDYKFLITLKDTFCKALLKYIGEFAFEMQKSAGLEPGTCPVPAGDYKVQDHLLEFEKFKYKDIPKGYLKIQSNLVDMKSNETMACEELCVTIE